jgi:hypothetical protein
MDHSDLKEPLLQDEFKEKAINRSTSYEKLKND